MSRSSLPATAQSPDSESFPTIPTQTRTPLSHSSGISPGNIPLVNPGSRPGAEIPDAEIASLNGELVSVIGKGEWHYWVGHELLVAGGRAGSSSFSVAGADVRAWYRLYGGIWTAALVLFGSKSVWKMQAQVLGRMPRRGPAGDPGGDPGGDDPYDSGEESIPGSGGCGRGDYAAEDYSRLVEGATTRIGVAGSIIASVIAAALAFDTLSQTHWVARAAWVYSLASSLMAVYCANNLSWKTGYLVLGRHLRAWISNHRGDPRSHYRRALQASSGAAKASSQAAHALLPADKASFKRSKASFEATKKIQLDQLWASVIPSPSSTLTVSAPAMLLSSSLLFLFVGFGIFFGFTWDRALDTSAGPDDSRDVFVVYMVSLGFCCFLFASSTTTSHDRTAFSTVQGAVGRNLKKAAGREEQQDMIKSLVDGMEMAKIAPDFEDYVGQTPLHWAAQKGLRLSVLRLLSRGADCNHSDRQRWTPLMMAAANDQHDIARDLLYAGATQSLKNGVGQTAWDIANERGYAGFEFLSVMDNSGP